MQINQKNYDEILVLAKTYGIKENICVFSRNEYSEGFLIELEMNTSSIEQSAFEEEVTRLLCKETGRRIFAVTEKDLEASIKTFKITEDDKKLILTNAKPLNQCIVAESLNPTPKPVIFSSPTVFSSTESTPTSSRTSSNTNSAISSTESSPAQQKAEEISHDIESFLLDKKPEDSSAFLNVLAEKVELLKKKYVVTNRTSQNNKGTMSF